MGRYQSGHLEKLIRDDRAEYEPWLNLVAIIS